MSLSAPGNAARPSLTSTSEKEVDAVTMALRAAPLTDLFGGHFVGEFERGFSALFDFSRAAAVTSGTSALHSALMALGVRSGDEVIVTPFSFVASVSVVVQCGATPVFADIDPYTFTIRPDAVADAVSPRTVGILPVHINGFPADMDGILSVAREHGLWVVEDCAAAPGAQWRDQWVGGIGDVGCFSFNIGKVIRTGEGGMVVCRDADIDHRVRQVRVNGITANSKEPNGIECLGSNYTMAQPLAAIGLTQLESFHDVWERRAQNEAIMNARLEEIGMGIPIPVAGSVRCPYASPYLLPRECAPSKWEVLAGLKRRGVPVSSGCGTPLAEIDYLRPFSQSAQLPVAYDVASRLIVFDPRPEYNESVVDGYADLVVSSVAALRD